MMLRIFGLSTLTGCLLLFAGAQCLGGEVRLRRNTLELNGEISADDPAKVRKLLKVDPKFISDGQGFGPTGKDYFAALEKAKKVKQFRVNSPGGNYLAAVELGTVIRFAGGFESMTVEIGAGSTCASACAVIALMNKTRVSKRAAVGVHRPYSLKPDGTMEGLWSSSSLWSEFR
jgi:hypothetical protein